MSRALDLDRTYPSVVPGVKILPQIDLMESGSALTSKVQGSGFQVWGLSLIRACGLKGLTIGALIVRIGFSGPITL